MNHPRNHKSFSGWFSPLKRKITQNPTPPNSSQSAILLTAI